MNGHIKLYRSIFEWEWWDDIKTFRLFVTILLLANWKEKKWHGKTIPRGSLWTSIPSLAKKSGLTIQETRTALNHLKSTGELTDEPTGEGRLITVANYEVYQNGALQLTDELTGKLTGGQQTSNRPLTSTEEYIRSINKGEKEGDPPGEKFYFFADID